MKTIKITRFQSIKQFSNASIYSELPFLADKEL